MRFSFLCIFFLIKEINAKISPENEDAWHQFQMRALRYSENSSNDVTNKMKISHNTKMQYGTIEYPVSMVTPSASPFQKKRATGHFIKHVDTPIPSPVPSQRSIPPENNIENGDSHAVGNFQSRRQPLNHINEQESVLERTIGNKIANNIDNTKNDAGVGDSKTSLTIKKAQRYKPRGSEIEGGMRGQIQKPPSYMDAKAPMIKNSEPSCKECGKKGWKGSPPSSL